MDLNIVRFIIDTTTRLWNYMLELQYKDKLDELHSVMDQLKRHRVALKSSVDAEQHPCTPAMAVWFQDFDDLEKVVADVLQEGSRLLDRSCLGVWCPWNCWKFHIFRNNVMSKISAVEDLRSRGNFGVLAISSRGRVQDLAWQEHPATVGLESTVDTVWAALQEDGSRIIGLYGMGGVGKTTLLKKINNKFIRSDSEFDLVIWVVVSKGLNLDQIQTCIGQRLGLSWPDANVDIRSRARDISEVLRTKRFVLLMDDIWERLDLPKIGIPLPNPENKSKVLFTTRSEIVCGKMDTDKKIRVECLKWDEAWKLFQDKVQNSVVFRDSAFKELTVAVAKECGGLPLALIVIGRTMASKRTTAEWKDAVTTLRKHAAQFTGMGDEVFPVLKFSYDNLQYESHKLCFLFCSLYPENHEIDIEHLVRRCIGEGYIDEFDEWEEAINTGHNIIGILKASCLLESAADQDSSKVKMHDVIRDLAHWIASGTDKSKIMVNTGWDVLEATPAMRWKSARGISFAATRIIALDDAPNCPYLLTLLLTDNAYLQHIHDDFFLHMPALRFLDLSGTRIKNLPTSISKLVRLEYLNVSHSNIQKLPDEMKHLINLKYLFLFEISGSFKISVGVIKHLFNLQVLELVARSFGDCEDDRLVGIQELGCLKQLISLEIKISNVKVLESFLNKPRLVGYTKSLFICEKDVECGQEIIKLALSDFSTSYSSCLSIGYMRRLRALSISNCKEIKELVVESLPDNVDIGLLQSLETMILYNLPKLKFVVSLDTCIRGGSCFRKLHHLEISYCGLVLNLTWLLLVPALRTLSVKECHGIKEIVPDECGACGENTFSSLKILSLVNLQYLRSIIPNTLLFPSLQRLEVSSCPELRKLPLGLNSAENNNLQSIHGSQEWWNNLKWDNEIVKARFTTFFKSPF